MIHPDSMPKQKSYALILKEKRGKGRTQINESRSFENSRETAATEERRKAVSTRITGERLGNNVIRHTFLLSTNFDISVPQDPSLPLSRVLVNLLMNPSYLLTVLTVANALMYMSALTF